MAGLHIAAREVRLWSKRSRRRVETSFQTVKLVKEAVKDGRANPDSSTRLVVARRQTIGVRLLVWFAAAILLGSAARRSSLAAADPNDVLYGRDVRPILSNHCFKCHGPDASARQANLRLDRDDATSRAVLESPSELVRRITSDDPEVRMPPPSSKIQLQRAEIEVLQRWIASGASYSRHWAFVSLPELDDLTVPPAHGSEWPINEIDRFVLARLRRAGIEPAGRASKEALIRRLSFDLTGLPPSLEAVDEFLADHRPDAYTALIDRLLSRQAYGERMAADWLDVARYSDTYGYQVDRDRFVWPWRDWVIKAFNDNLPYDQFIAWQLAGDLLPNATDEQVLATTFNRLHPQKVEGGSVPEEFRVEYVADRNHTFATAFLGLTLECARCHDHKYDPISQREYYQLFAFFNSIDEAGLYSYFTKSIPTPTLLLASEETKREVTALKARERDAEEAVRRVAAGRREAFQRWCGTVAEVSPLGRIAHRDFDDASAVAPHRTVSGKVGSAVELTGDDQITLEKIGNFRRFEPFTVALWLQTPDLKQRAVVFHRSRAWTDAGSRGYELLLENGRLSAALIHFWPGNALRVRSREPIPLGEWLHVAVTYDGSSRADGLKILINGEEADVDVVQDRLAKNITGGGGDDLAIGARSRDRGFSRGRVDEFQVFSRELTPLEVRHLYDGSSLHEALASARSDATADGNDALFRYYLATADDKYEDALAQLRQAREAVATVVDPIQEIMVMRESSTPRPTFVLRRGAYNAPTERVRPGTPSIFPPFPESAPRNRLGLARWLTDPGQPLTARVTVNRVWRLLFGHGLVRTPEDFGSQGESPTHPDLLDWLARDFVSHGWDLKRLVKMIASSSTYRQSSSADVEVVDRDPENRLLARAPSYRLSAEMLRDNVLAVSGLLVRDVGGAPAKPYDLEVSFKPIKPDQGGGLYRRSLYTFWKRTAPAPVMMAFDAAKRDVCTVKRETTSSPLQTLVLLNGPQFVEAARVLGELLLVKHGGDAEPMVVEAFRLLTSRRPEANERRVLLQLLDEQLVYFESDAAGTEKYLAVGAVRPDSSLSAPRLAAISVVVGALMSYDGCVMKR